MILKLKTGNNEAGLRLVKGSHIVTKRLFDGDHAYIFQNADSRIIFAIPYEENFTLIGTTDIPYQTSDGAVEISDEETLYLCDAVNEYFQPTITPKDVVWTYSGVRPLDDDKSENASAVTRDYVLHLDEFTENAPFLSIFGGKITTSRKLAEHALEKLSPYYEGLSPAWTKNESLPGGDIPNADFDSFVSGLLPRYPNIDPTFLSRLARRYGTRINQILEGVTSSLGQIFADQICESEVKYLIECEWATTAQDILWRRTKCGLHMSKDETDAFIVAFERIKKDIMKHPA